MTALWLPPEGRFFIKLPITGQTTTGDWTIASSARRVSASSRRMVPGQPRSVSRTVNTAYFPHHIPHPVTSEQLTVLTTARQERKATVNSRGCLGSYAVAGGAAT
jgi:hypothetical protein